MAKTKSVSGASGRIPRRASWRRGAVLALVGVAVLAVGVREAAAGALGGCIENEYGGSLGCTSQDVKITTMDLLSVIDGCTGPSDTATVTLQANVQVNAANRYDLGFYLSTDGGNARTGSCFKEWLTPVKAPVGTNPTAAELLTGYGPYLDADADACGDGKSTYGIFDRLLSTAVDPAVPATITLPCTDVDVNGNLDLNYCAGWKNSSNPGCTDLAQAGIPDVGSKCNCESVNLPVAVPATDPLDWGDAPGSYSTLSAANGPRHTIVGTSPRLGACIDSESNGLPNVAATGDDANVGTTTAGSCATAGDDEDGVTFGTFIPGQSTSITVTATGACTLSAFIDWAADGNFSTAGDDILPTGQLLSAGANVVNVNVPIGAALGNTYARFRCTTAGKVGYTGLAANGEVEDYRITITQLPPSLTVTKKVMLAGGTCGVNDVAPSLTIYTGQQVEYCYYVAAAGPAGSRAPVYDVTLVDDMATPSNPADDQTITLSGLTNLGGNPGIGDLAAGATATGKSAPVQF